MDANNVADIVFPDDVIENYLILDEPYGNSRIIVFSSDFGLQTLMKYQEQIAIDGTFKSSPRGFVQLYTVSTLIDRVAVPCVYALLPGKAQELYERIFKQ